jgi:hypothetical protein
LVEFATTNEKAVGSVLETLELELTGFCGLSLIGSAIDTDELIVGFAISQIMGVPQQKDVPHITFPVR